jgi:hypothetical protein
MEAPGSSSFADWLLGEGFIIAAIPDDLPDVVHYNSRGTLDMLVKTAPGLAAAGSITRERKLLL